MKQDGRRVSRSLFSIRGYIMFFLMISFIVTCCFLVFLRTMEIELPDIRRSAVMTFFNVLFLSLLCTLIDSIRRKVMVERPVKRILNAAQQLTQGDFSARIKPLHGFESRNELDIIIEDFNKMAEELSSIETLRTDFISSVSHELKTPLAVIHNYATMLQNPDLLPEKRIQYAAAVKEGSQRLSELISNILKLNKLENQQIYPGSKTYELGEQLRECLLGFEDQLDKKNLSVETDIDEINVKADEELLSLVWNNLFSNAVKFTEPGGKITVSLKPDEDWTVVSITDSGCGISSETGKHIFEKFYQGDDSHATEGNGLGLALVKRVMGILGGEISVQSTVGQGSTFTVKIKGGWNDFV